MQDIFRIPIQVSENQIREDIVLLLKTAASMNIANVPQSRKTLRIVRKNVRTMTIVKDILTISVKPSATFTPHQFAVQSVKSERKGNQEILWKQEVVQNLDATLRIGVSLDQLPFQINLIIEFYPFYNLKQQDINVSFLFHSNY